MNPRFQIYAAVFGIAGLTFGLGMQLAITIVSGDGWWKIGVAVFSILCLAFVLANVVRRNLPKISN
jgi:hypothetical protein